MKTILSLSLALMLAATSAYARNQGGGGHQGGSNPGPSAPSPSTPSAPADSVDRDSSASRTNYSMAEDGIARKVASNFCVTWARDAYCAKN